MKSINLNELKNKFGYLLSYAHLQCDMNDTSISVRIEQSSYFDFLENWLYFSSGFRARLSGKYRYFPCTLAFTPAKLPPLSSSALERNICYS